MAQPTQIRALVADALRQGADTVDEVHQAVARMSSDQLRRFGLAGAADSLDQASDQVRRVARDFLSQTPGTEGDRSARQG